MTKLYIIGNGFDLWHGLPTSYDQFYQYAKETLDDLEKYFYIDEKKCGPWSDFENSLGKFDWKLMYDAYDYTDITADNFRTSEAFGLEDELKEQTDCLVETIKNQFHSWIEQIDILATAKKLKFNISDRFINFNYTSTLQLIYGINDKNIRHMHGRSKTSGELVFGHLNTMKEEPELDENGDSNRTIFTDAANASKYPFYAFQKPVNKIIVKNRDFFENLNNITTIIVIGHSLNKIDLPYFKEVAKNTAEAKWIVCCYKQEDKIDHIQQLLKCDIKKDKISTCTYADLKFHQLNKA